MQLSNVPPQWEIASIASEALSAAVIFRLSDNIKESQVELDPAAGF